MQPTSLIGPTIIITGDVSADEPLTIAGRVDGTVRVNAHVLTIDRDGNANANVQADTIVVSGHVVGSLTATVRLVVEESAVIYGTVTAPLVSVADGAQVHGRIEVAGTKGAAGLKLAS